MRCGDDFLDSTGEGRTQSLTGEDLASAGKRLTTSTTTTFRGHRGIMDPCPMLRRCLGRVTI